MFGFHKKLVIDQLSYCQPSDDCVADLRRTVVNGFTFLDQPNDCQLPEDCDALL